MTKASKNILVCVAWPYVNGDLHIGHLAGNLLPPDIFARYQRLKGNNVLMVSGSDCYGTPITVEADKRKVTPQEIVNEYHPKDVDLFRSYELNYNLYTKTANSNHDKVTQDLFLNLLKNRYIIKKSANQFFAVDDNKFLPDRYVEGKCSNCGAEKQRSDQCEVCGKLLNPEDLINPYSKLSGSKIILKETEHYYIDLPKLAPKLKTYVESKKAIWRKDAYSESLAYLESGLEPRPITRDIDWGVEIPVKEIPDEMKLENAANKRFYVWFDAVIGYLSATIEYCDLVKSGKEVDPKEYLFNKDFVGDFSEFWTNPDARHYYFMGKDNLLFHTLLWPAQLIGAYENYNLPYFVARNQFYNLQGKKFSKSRGWIIDSKEILNNYGVNSVRFYIELNLPENKDGDFDWKDFIETNNAVLVGNLGNFINRVISFTSKNYEEKVPNGKLEAEIEAEINKTFEDVSKSIEGVKLVEALNKICTFGNFANKYFNDSKVWEVVKYDKETAGNKLYNCIQIISALSTLLAPFIPDGSNKILEQLGVEIIKTSVNIDNWSLKAIEAGHKLNFIGPIFNKIDVKQLEIELEKLSKLP